MTIDPRRLRELLEISRRGSYTEAAAELKVSQPALSNSIRILEDQLGARLLNRNRRGAAATELGKVLTAYAEVLESLLSRAAEDFERHKAGLLGTLVVGVTPIAAAGLVPTAVRKLIAKTPNIWIRVEEDLDDRLLQQLVTGELDMMVGPIRMAPIAAVIEETPLFEDQFEILLRPGNPLAARKSLSLKQLQDAHWIMPEIGTASRRQMETLFSEAGLPWPLRVISTNSVAAIKAIVAETDCVSFVSPRLVRTEIAAGLLKCVSPRGARYARTIGVRRSKSGVPSMLATRFVTALREVVGEEADKRKPRGDRR